jgi:hypothetical protein
MNTVKSIQSKKACYEAVIQSEAKPAVHQDEKEQAQETDRQKEKDTLESSEAE